jgi:copper chaperone CopZ
MPKALFAVLLLLATNLIQAETTVTMEGVHNCCKGCTNGIIKAASGIKDTTVTADGETVTIVAKSKSNAKKAVEAIMEAGYYGKPSDDSAASSPRKSDKKLTDATVTGAHLCCQKCVNAMTAAVKAVPGVTGYTIENKAKTFTVQGQFTESDLLASMNKVGFHGSVK